MVKMKNKISALFEDCGCFVGTLVLLVCLVIIGILAFGIVCFEGWIFMLLYNWLAVLLFGAVPLGYWVCVGIVFALNFLGRIIFGRTSTKTE